MALDQSWILILCVVISVTIGIIIWLVFNNQKEQLNSKSYFSNTARLTKLPAYNALMKEYRLAIGACAGLLALAIALSAVLAAKPVQVESYTPTKYNRDIVLCLDLSGSMYEVDLQIVQKFQTMIEGFKGERIALVVWNSTSNLVFPLTDDYEYISAQLKDVATGLDPQVIMSGSGEGYDFTKYTLNGEGGSLIGDGLTACTLSFDKEDATEDRSKSIILATDNVVNGEEIISLEEAALYAKEQGVKVYGIRPETGWEVGGEAEAMQEAVESTEGIFYPLSDSTAVSGIVTKIEAEEAGAIQGQTIVTKTDSPQPWIIGILIVLLFSFGLFWRYKI